MNNKKLIFDAAYEEALKLGLNNYETQYIAKMVLRKVRHPEETIYKITKNVERKMAKIYKHTEISCQRRLDILHDSIDGANISDELKNSGDEIVKETIEELVTNVVNKIDQK